MKRCDTNKARRIQAENKLAACQKENALLKDKFKKYETTLETLAYLGLTIEIDKLISRIPDSELITKEVLKHVLNELNKELMSMIRCVLGVTDTQVLLKNMTQVLPSIPLYSLSALKLNIDHDTVEALKSAMAKFNLPIIRPYTET